MIRHPHGCACKDCMVNRALNRPVNVPMINPLQRQAGGGMKIDIGITEDKKAVVIRFSDKVSFMGMTAPQAKVIASKLVEMAEKLEQMNS